MVDEDEVEEPDEGDTVVLDADEALVRAANTLTLAMEMAETLNDTQSMLKIAQGWLEIHECLGGGAPRAEKKNRLGFVAPSILEEEDEEELDDAIAAEDRASASLSRSRVHPQHGKLRKSQGRYFRRG